jgi:glycosyltransferase involved in cell wall biosynthesis
LHPVEPCPRISVVIPAYRAWGTLPDVLSALRPQIEGRNREAIVVESSGDGRAAELARDAPWARVIVLPARALPGAARNTACLLARGELIAFTDADSVPVPGWLDELDGALGPGVDAVAGAVLNGTPRNPVGTAGYLLEFVEWIPGRRGPPLHAATCSLLVRRDALEASGGFRTDVWPGEDTILTFAFGASGRLAFAPAARVRHLNRTGLRAFLRHQRLLGAAFAEVCASVDFPRGRLVHPGLTLIVPGLRLFGLDFRLRHHPRQAAAAAALSPLLALGAVAWAVGLAEGRRSVRSRRVRDR